MLKKILGLTKNDGAVREVEQVSEALDRYDRIFRGSRGYGFLDWDLAAGITRWHGGFWSHLGYDDAMVRKISRSERFIKFVHPDDRESFSLDIVDILKSKGGSHLTFRVFKRDGDYVWVELRVDAVRKQNGRVSHLSGVIFDISNLKKAEETLKKNEAIYQRIIKSSNDGMWEWSINREGKRLKRLSKGSWDWTDQIGSYSFSDRIWEMLGYSMDDDLVSGGLLAWFNLMHEDDRKDHENALMAHVKTGVPFDHEYRARNKDGEWCWIRCRGAMVFDSDGYPNMISGTNIDVTELKLAEEQVMQAKDEAEKASQAKSEFLSSMSHEFRTPLNAILGFAQLIALDQRLSAAQRDHVKEIRAAGEHLLELVGDVLDLAKIEARRLQFVVERVLPSRLVNECSALLNPQIEQHDLSLNVNFNELETTLIQADSVRLKQVLINLISNAAKYNTTGGSINIDFSISSGAFSGRNGVDADSLDADGVEHGRLRVTVADTGTGIPERLQGELFQAFNRLGAENSGIEGSGVGLVITQQLVQQMGGEIGFSSEEGTGSQFWVEFPQVHTNGEDESVEIPVALSKDIDSAPALCVSSIKSVLYVEDNPSNQKLMRQLLAKYPMLDLTVVGLAVQGLYLARSTRPDLIILDVNLPGVSGNEMVEILKQDPATAQIPVIALSANVLSHDIQKGMDSGFDLYLTKPLKLGELITACNRMLSQSL